jgi:hypothetical protein
MFRVRDILAPIRPKGAVRARKTLRGTVSRRISRHPLGVTHKRPHYTSDWIGTFTPKVHYERIFATQRYLKSANYRPNVLEVFVILMCTQAVLTVAGYL